MKDFENDLKLSDSNPISLCPQVTVNGDELVNLITNLDVKVNNIYIAVDTICTGVHVLGPLRVGTI